MSAVSPSILARLSATLLEHYPNSHLIAEFLTYQEGQYAIRAVVKIGETIISSGMATDANIEIAEDRAKIRAIEALNLTMDDFSNQASLQSNPPMPKQQIRVDGDVVGVKGDRLPTTLEYRPGVVHNQNDETGTEDGPTLPHPAPNRPRTASIDMDRSTSLSEPPHGGVSLLDQIAKTEVEMRRLGWDVHQGRQALLERYGKRSRRELTDDEVMDFLHHLEQQP